MIQMSRGSEFQRWKEKQLKALLPMVQRQVEGTERWMEGGGYEGAGGDGSVEEI